MPRVGRCDRGQTLHICDSHLEEAFTSLTRSHTIVLAGCVVPTHCTAPFAGPWASGLGGGMGALHKEWAVQGSLLQSQVAEGLGRGVLGWLGEWVLLRQRRLLSGVQRWGLLHRSVKGEKGGGLRQAGLVWYPAAGARGVGGERRIPGRHWLCLVAWGGGRGRCRQRTAVVVGATGGQGLIKVAEGKCSWVAAVHLEVIQLEGGLLVMGARGPSASLGRSGGGRWDLAGKSVKLPGVVSHQGVDTRERGSRELVRMTAEVHDQLGGEIWVQKLRVEVGIFIRQASILSLNAGHCCNIVERERERSMLLRYASVFKL